MTGVAIFKHRSHLYHVGNSLCLNKIAFRILSPELRYDGTLFAMITNSPGPKVIYGNHEHDCSGECAGDRHSG
jgi:hypothetical protein